MEIKKSMKDCINAAFTEHAIVTSDGLNDGELIFVANGKAYYEDGGCLGSRCETLDLLNSMEWARKYEWYVIGYMTKEEYKQIKQLCCSQDLYDSNKFAAKVREILGVGGNE